MLRIEWFLSVRDFFTTRLWLCAASISEMFNMLLGGICKPYWGYYVLNYDSKIGPEPKGSPPSSAWLGLDDDSQKLNKTDLHKAD